MSYDWHFECGRKEKHNNWAMHTFAMMLFYELGIWTKDQLEIELTKSSMAMSEAMASKPKSKDKGKDPIHAIVTVEKIPTEKIGEIKELIFTDEEDDNIEAGESWIAKVGFKDKPSELRIEEFLKNAESTLLHAIRQAKRTDFFIEECKGSPYTDLFTRLLKNDGGRIEALESAFLLTKFMSIRTTIHKMANEYMPVDIPSLIGHLAYSAGGNSFRVY